MPRVSEAASDHPLSSLGSLARYACRALVAVGTAALFGCSDGEPKSAWTTTETEHFRLHTSAGDPLACPGYADEVDAQIVGLWEFLGVPATQRQRVEFYQLSAEQLAEGAAPCMLQEGLRGCSRGPVGYGVPSSLQHELVHAALDGVGLPPPLFSEGIAVAVTCSPEPGLQLGTPSGDWRARLRDDVHTGFASLLVTHLLDEFGPEAFLQLYGRVPYDAPDSEVAETFRAIYGESLDDVWSAALDSARSCLALTACQTRIAQDETVQVGRGCDSQLAYRLPSETAQVAVDGPGMLWRTCEQAAPSGLPSLTPNNPVWFSPAGGSYAVEYDDVWPATVLSVTPTPGVLTGSCSETRPILVTSEFAQRAVLAPQVSPFYVELQADDPLAMVWHEYSGATNQSYSWNVETCLGCEAGQGSDCGPSGTAQQGRIWMKVTWNAPFVREIFAVEFRPL